MIEGVDGAADRGRWNPREYARNQRFDVACLDLDVDLRSRDYRQQNFLECWNADAWRELDRGQLGGFDRRDRAAGEERAGLLGQVRFLIYDDDTVSRGVRIQLDSISPRVESGDKSRKRVFGVSVANATMSDGFESERSLSHGIDGGCGRNHIH